MEMYEKNEGKLMFADVENHETTWILSAFQVKDLYAPFVLDKDNEYFDALEKKYNLVIQRARDVGADDQSIEILETFSKKIMESLGDYQNADVEECYGKIRKLIKEIGTCLPAVGGLKDIHAFCSGKGSEIQLFKCRTGNPVEGFGAEEMLHLPKSLRSKAGNYRFSIPGNPSLYLSNTSYGCWIELGCPDESEFNVAPFLLDGKQRIFNLTISNRDTDYIESLDEEQMRCWLKLYLLAIATSFRIKEPNRAFKSEYVISQSIMIACKKLGYDGVAYFSKRVDDELFALCALNLALFVDYNEGEYSDLVKNHLKLDDAFNYSFFKKLLNQSRIQKKYDELQMTHTEYVTNIKKYGRQYLYRETLFYEFDKFLFISWRDKGDGRGKDQIPWGYKSDS